MTLESQVASLDLCKRLKELGVKQESLFYWSFHKAAKPELKLSDALREKTHWEDFAAFTVAELGEMLPPMTPSKLADTSVNERRWSCGMYPDDFRAKTEADARAAMLIYLIEQGLVKP